MSEGERTLQIPQRRTHNCPVAAAPGRPRISGLAWPIRCQPRPMPGRSTTVGWCLLGDCTGTGAGPGLRTQGWPPSLPSLSRALAGANNCPNRTPTGRRGLVMEPVLCTTSSPKVPFYMFTKAEAPPQTSCREGSCQTEQNNQQNRCAFPSGWKGSQGGAKALLGSAGHSHQAQKQGSLHHALQTDGCGTAPKRDGTAS